MEFGVVYSLVDSFCLLAGFSSIASRRAKQSASQRKMEGVEQEADAARPGAHDAPDAVAAHDTIDTAVAHAAKADATATPPRPKSVAEIVKLVLTLGDKVMMILLLFLQKQNLASTIYLFGLGTRLSGPGLKHMR